MEKEKEIIQPEVGDTFTRRGSVYKIRKIMFSFIYFVDVLEDKITGVYEYPDFIRDQENGSTKVNKNELVDFVKKKKSEKEQKNESL